MKYRNICARRPGCQTLEEDCNSQIEFSIEKVKSISKKKSGKRELIIQKLDK